MIARVTPTASLQSLPRIQSDRISCAMSCATAHTLFDDYSNATMEFFEATDRLSVLLGQHEEFAEAKKQSDQKHTKCLIARRPLEQHWEEHGCRAREGKTPASR